MLGGSAHNTNNTISHNNDTITVGGGQASNTNPLMSALTKGSNISGPNYTQAASGLNYATGKDFSPEN